MRPGWSGPRWKWKVFLVAGVTLLASALPLFQCRATSEESGLEMCDDVGQAPPRSGLLAAPVPSEHNFNNAVCLLLSDDFEGPWAKLNTTANNSIAHIFYDCVLGAIKIFICFFVQPMFNRKRRDHAERTKATSLRRRGSDGSHLRWQARRWRRWCRSDLQASLEVGVMLMLMLGSWLQMSQLTWLHIDKWLHSPQNVKNNDYLEVISPDMVRQLAD